MGNEDRKGGHGKGNWGKEGEEGAAPAEGAEGATKSWKEAEAEEPEEPEPDTKSMEEFEAERIASNKAMEKKLSGLGAGAIREVEADFGGEQKVNKKDQEGDVMFVVSFLRRWLDTR